MYTWHIVLKYTTYFQLHLSDSEVWTWLRYLGDVRLVVYTVGGTAGYRQDSNAELAAGLLDVADVVSMNELTGNKDHCQHTQHIKRRHCCLSPQWHLPDLNCHWQWGGDCLNQKLPQIVAKSLKLNRIFASSLIEAPQFWYWLATGGIRLQTLGVSSVAASAAAAYTHCLSAQYQEFYLFQYFVDVSQSLKSRIGYLSDIIMCRRQRLTTKSKENTSQSKEKCLGISAHKKLAPPLPLSATT